MEIGSLSIAMSQARVQQEVSIAVVKMAIDTGKENETMLKDLMKDIALEPNLGNNIDISI